MSGEWTPSRDDDPYDPHAPYDSGDDTWGAQEQRSTNQRIETPRDLARVLGVPYTEEQLSAITAPLEPGVIVAGAGSGKTTVMAARVVWLVATGWVGPGEVLGLTFTNKAAAELRERVRTALAAAGFGAAQESDFKDPSPEPAPDELGEPVISTYHAYADRLIKEHGLRLGLEPSTRLLADASRYTLAARVVRNATGPFDALRGSISNITRDLIDLDAELSEHVVGLARLAEFDRAFADAAELYRDPVTGKSIRAVNRRTNKRGAIYERYLDAAVKARERGELLTLVEEYRKLKASRDLMDFGDQMAIGTRLAEEAPEVGAIERGKYRVILLDEYQDTSVAQRRMLSALFSGPDPERGLGQAVTAVGDPCQSIYGWRGASAANIDQFPEHFPRADGRPARVYPLTENRRSGGRLLAFANEQSVPLRQFHDSVRRLEPAAEKAGLGYAVAALLPTYAEEVRWLADQIQDLDGQVPWSQVAVLVRKGDHIPELYAELHGRGVPVEVVGLSGLLDLPEVADLVAMLDVLDDPIANASLVRLLAGPRWRIGPRDLALLGKRARELVRVPAQPGASALDQAAANSDPTDVVSLSDALADPGGELPYSTEARQRFARFAAEIRRLRRSLSEPVLDVLHRILQETGLEVEIAASPAAFRQRCADTVGAFLHVAGAFSGLEGEHSATAFRAFLRASAEHERGLDIDLPPTAAQTVKILTMHKAKGLEWEVVVVPHQHEEPAKIDKWTAKRSKLPHELRGDPMPLLGPERDKADFEDFDAQMREHAELESQRLNYVTLTRAKSRLIVSSHRWGPTQTTPRKPNAMLTALHEHCVGDPANGEVAVWAPPPDKEESNPALAAARELAWPPDVNGETRDRRRQAAEAVLAELRAMREAQAGADARGEADAGSAHESGSEPAAGDLARRSTQELSRERHDAGDASQRSAGELPPESRATIASWDADIEALLGELERAHQVRFDVPMPRTLSATRLVSYAADPDAFAEELFRPMPRPPAPQARRGTEFHAWVERRFGQQALFGEDELDLLAEDEEIDGHEDLAELQAAFLRTPYANREPYRVEAPFQLVLGGHIVRGRIDAVYREPDGTYEVVDWKTNRAANADPLQLAIYRLAWAELTAVPIEQVSAAFLYVRTGLIQRPDDLPDRAGLERLLAARTGPS
ncbi:ATP-dependent DNA helicase [Actinocrinis sp.]|uniref:ATP-dependent helicase n=1 Tax=Actinocrinis sp. TaxID=1920516 RepID=UPI002B6645B1|nr:ATP-dependent DNA helicase [Actinocrinis sp.]HXR71702.1 ATP-dependent DNA helicase [Actinocrinis sp.]